ncbi:hypothetical protein GXY_16167 [Novacetimonas hansenii ATCC 23769]|uniref:Uncharacterized protein n=1 Tax=Novacetimonas hansenii ATCC 23769 TaxID=714995 RepID=D5QJA0_NOVHA|nr:hypothetical protein GXY_16167 [Novacetimonas hansenii ATCC 23769]
MITILYQVFPLKYPDMPARIGGHSRTGHSDGDKPLFFWHIYTCGTFGFNEPPCPRRQGAAVSART